MITSNLHTHSFYCGHGHGTISEYVQKGKDLGLKVLGFSEHLPFPNNKLSRSRMDFSQMSSYESDVLSFKADKDIKILLGYEADYFENYYDYMSQIKERVEFLTFGVHYIKTSAGYISPFVDKLGVAELTQYFNQFKAAMESKLFTFAAHPDLFYSGYLKWDENAISVSKDMIALSKEYDIPLEINGNGLLKTIRNHQPNYPYHKFWDLAFEEGAKVIVGFDAHEVEDLKNSGDELNKFCSTYNYKYYQSELEDNKLVFKKDMGL